MGSEEATSSDTRSCHGSSCPKALAASTFSRSSRASSGVDESFVNRRHDNHRENMAQFVVDRREDLTGTVIPFFRQNPLRTAKQGDFEKFAACVKLVSNGRHLTPAGLIEIAEIAQTMNRRKSRQELIRILRDYTPETLDRGS